jgi:membrane protease YdiL (CAAX protease family)
MFLKSAFKDSSAFVQLLVLVIIAFAGVITASFIGLFFILMKWGFSPDIINEMGTILQSNPDLLRSMQFFQTLGMFFFPAIFCAWLFSDNYKNYLRIDTPVHLPVLGLILLSILVAIPFLNFTYAINQQMVFPEWMKGLEEWMKRTEISQSELQEKMLYAENLWDLLFIVVVVCVLAAVGEEFIFRGLLQNIFGKTIKNPHIVIWTVAVLFSVVHLQFLGFLPRMLLGAYLGYLLYYTKNIWAPIFAHFINNFVSVIIFHIFRDSPEKVKEIDNFGYGATTWIAAVSLVLFVFLFREIRKRSLSDFNDFKIS